MKQQLTKFMYLTISFLLFSNTSLAKTYLIGGSGGITGPISSLVGPWTEGALDYCKYTNEMKLLGKEDKLDCKTLDDGFKPAVFRRNIETLMDEDLLILTGGAPADINVMVKDLEEENLPNIAATGELLFLKSPISFQPFSTGPEFAAALLEKISRDHQRKGPAKVAFLYIEQGAASKQTINIMREVAKKLGNVELTATVPHSGAEVDHSTSLRKVKAAGVEYAIVFSIEYTTSIILKNLNALNILATNFGEKGKVSLLGGNYAGGSTFLALSGPLAKNMMFVSNIKYGNDMVEKIGKRYKRKPSKINDTNYNYGIHVMSIAVEALRQTKKKYGKVERKLILQTLRDDFVYKSQTTFAPIKFTARDHRPQQLIQLYTFDNGKYKTVDSPFYPKSMTSIVERFLPKAGAR